MSIKLYSPTNLEKRFAPYLNWAHLYEIPATNVGPQPLYRLQHFKHRRTELLSNTKADIIIFVNVCNQRGKKGEYIEHLWMYQYDDSENVRGLIHVLRIVAKWPQSCAN